MKNCQKFKKKMLDIKNIIYLEKKYGTPFWLYNKSHIKKQIEKLKKFDIIRFAQKSCSNIHILKIMKSKGVKVDAVSYGEIYRAILANYNTNNDDIVFTSDIIEEEVIKIAKKYKLTINAGSNDMLKTIGKKLPNNPIWIRINPRFGDGHHFKTNTGGENSKHGIWNIKKSLKIIKKYKLNLIGLHMHIGSGVNYKHLSDVCKSMQKYAIKINHKILKISAGGGLSFPYKNLEDEVNIDNYYNLWNKTRKIIEKKLKCTIKLEIEPGRFLVAGSGVLIAKVMSVKTVGGNNFVILNSGFNDLIRPILYGSYHKISIFPKRKKNINKKKFFNYIISGPLCESGDIFTVKKNGEPQSRKFEKIFPGDIAVIYDTGAYGSTMSSTYNSRPLIPEILYEKNNFSLIRKRQTIQEIIELENNL